MVKINGIGQEAAGMSLTEYLHAADYDVNRVAVERNGEIVPKAEYETVRLQDGDNLEVVSFVGGG